MVQAAREPDARQLLGDRVVAAASPDFHTLTALDGVYAFVSPSCHALFGWHPHELTGAREEAFVHPDDVTAISEARLDAVRASGGTVVTVYRLRTADGTYRWVERLARAVELDSERWIVSSSRDIADRRKSELELLHRASTDPLTGVANRAVFMDRLQQALWRLDRRDGLVAVLFLDLDHFKLINDTAGHLAGDAVLLKMAERLRTFLRPHDTLARLGGDEFAIVVEDLDWPEQAIALGTRIIEAGRAPFVTGEEHFTCTTSVGIAMTSDASGSAESLLQEADLALYRAKGRGRDRAEVFDEDLRTRVVGRLATERMLRRAIDHGHLRVHYQPIIDVQTGATVAAEALVRVWDPGRDVLIPAEEFIEVAEDAGVLPAMDEWLLGQVIEQAAKWRADFAGTAFTDLGINVTARHLADADFAQSLIAELAAHDLPTDALQIEVTERVLMEASNSTMSGLTLLRGAGVKVGLDDFGTGYSSLSYLRVFPLDFVKIDRSFIAELRPGSAGAAIVKSIIDLSHGLGMGAVAEGVETEDQLTALRALGCDRAQGYLLARPGPPVVVEALVLAEPPSMGPVAAIS